MGHKLCCKTCGGSSGIRKAFLPELGTPHSGKVRDIYELKDGSLAIIASDRISVFDVILNELVPDKGRLLTGISKFWFENTKDIIQNHTISFPDPSVMIVKKCQPLMVEVVVRGYIAGSMWRDYKGGKREKCGIKIPEGLNQYDRLPEIMVTPTTKSTEGHDEDITAEELIQRGVVTRELWNQIESIAKRLYQRGEEILDKKGLILVDAKYEFGLNEEGSLVLIDEIHTPDSSRFWFKSEKEKNEVKFPDKELLRIWMRDQGFSGEGKAPAIPQEVIEQVRKGYVNIYENIVGQPLEKFSESPSKRLTYHLKKAGLIKGSLVILVLDREKDQGQGDKIAAVLAKHGVPHMIVDYAHKQPTEVIELMGQFNESLEPLVIIGISRGNNALGEGLASKLKWPVINCLGLQNDSESVKMPDIGPALTAIDAENAALAAIKILKIAG